MDIVDVDALVQTFTVISWAIFVVLMLIGLPSMYRSVWNFVLDDDTSLALFAFFLPLCFCAGWGLMVYYFPMLSGALMCYFIAKTNDRSN